MFRYEQRDKSGPMDVDNPDPMARLAQYAVPRPDEGPSRKRMHMDVDEPSRPFASSSSSSSSANTLHFGTNTPFIFHSAPRSPGYEPYDPSKWAAKDFKFGFSGGTAGTGNADDVEMRFGDSPARGKLPAEQQDEAEPEAGQASGGKMDDKPKQPAAHFEVGQGAEAEAEGRKIASGAVSRVRRKRQKEWRRRRGSESEPDERHMGPAKSEHTYNLHMPTQALQHSEIPSILLGYLQFFVNVSIVVFCIFLAVQFVLTVKHDVKDRMREHSVELLQEIAECTNLYLTNRCDPSLRVPAMEAACRAWELCMNRDPTVIGRIDVVAETFAGVINSFVDPISWKTMGFTLVTLSFLVILTNSALFNLRSRHAPPPPPSAHNPYQHQQQHYLQHQGYPPYPGHMTGPPSIASHPPQHHPQGAIGWAGGHDGSAKKKGWW